MSINPESIPRYAQPLESADPEYSCCFCAYCKVVDDIPLCVYGVFHAVKLSNLVLEDLVRVSLMDLACDKFKEADAL